MNNLNPLLNAVRLCFVLMALLACPPLAARTNIGRILCDDMGYSDIGCDGGEIRTPNLDRLAKEGMRFTQFYNCAKCNTTRASILTGLHPRFRAGLTRSMVPIGEVLGEAGGASDHLIEKLYRDVKAMDIVEGTGQIQRVIMARQLVQLPR